MGHYKQEYLAAVKPQRKSHEIGILAGGGLGGYWLGSEYNFAVGMAFLVVVYILGMILWQVFVMASANESILDALDQITEKR